MPKEINPKKIIEKILSENLRRIIYLPFVAIPVNLFHILFFYYKLPDTGSPEYTWRWGIIVMHIIIMVVVLMATTLSLIRKKYQKPRDSVVWFFIYFFAALILLIGVAITMLDQIVTTAITPLIVITVLVAMVFLLRPRIMLIFYLLTFVVFFLMAPLTQNDPNVLLSIRVNAFSVMGLCFVLSLILWRNIYNNYRQAMMIEAQQQELENYNLRLREQAARLSDLNATKDRFFSIIAHDLRSPFTGIIGFSEILKADSRNLDVREIEEYSGVINSAASQTLRLLENLLDWARIQQGQFPFIPRQLILNELIKDALVLPSESARQKNIAIRNLVPRDTIIYADENMIMTLIRNLVSNAVKFTHQGGWIEISAKSSGNEIKVSVRDNGTGIEKENQETIFRIDSNMTSRGTGNEKGTGLGLILCKEFVEKHNGTIWVESEPGKGSEFIFTVPAGKTNEFNEE